MPRHTERRGLAVALAGRAAKALALILNACRSGRPTGQARLARTKRCRERRLRRIPAPARRDSRCTGAGTDPWPQRGSAWTACGRPRRTTGAHALLPDRPGRVAAPTRSEEHTSELQSIMRI